MIEVICVCFLQSVLIATIISYRLVNVKEGLEGSPISGGGATIMVKHLARRYEQVSLKHVSLRCVDHPPKLHFADQSLLTRINAIGECSGNSVSPQVIHTLNKV